MCAWTNYNSVVALHYLPLGKEFLCYLPSLHASHDNKSAIEPAKKLVQNGRSKHIDTGLHFLRDHVKKKMVKLVYSNTEKQVADIYYGFVE